MFDTPATDATLAPPQTRDQEATANSQSAQLKQSALGYVAYFKFSVFPCLPRNKIPFPNSHGVKDSSIDSRVIEAWWTKTPYANIAIACGKASGGLVVIDVDGEEGQNTMAALEAQHGTVSTSKVITGKGYQLYFKSQLSFKNHVRIAPGIDVRSDGGHVIAPPSIHPNGRVYRWQPGYGIEEVGIASLPSWLGSMILGPVDHQAQARQTANNRELILAQGATAGKRNSSLASLAGYLFSKNLKPQIILELLGCWNIARNRPPLSDSEITKTVQSIAKKDLTRRLSEVHHD